MLVLLTTIIVLIIVVTNQRSTVQEMKGQLEILKMEKSELEKNGLCLPCENLEVGSIDDSKILEGLRRENEAGIEDQCCAKDKGEFEILMTRGSAAF